jgi:hypothetical protein
MVILQLFIFSLFFIGARGVACSLRAEAVLWRNELPIHDAARMGREVEMARILKAEPGLCDVATPTLSIAFAATASSSNRRKPGAIRNRAAIRTVIFLIAGKLDFSDINPHAA